MGLMSLATNRSNIPKILPKILKFKDGKFIFPFAKPQNLFNSSGTLREEGMMLCHMTDYIPKNGIIQSTRAATGAMRDSVHFSVNHSVAAHACGDWSGKKFAILMPLKGARKMSGNNFAGGIATDFYSIGSVRIPPNSVIVRHNSKLPKGKYRIINASEFKELAQLKKSYVIETSNPDFQQAVDDIIAKCGYELRQTQDPFVWGKMKDKGQHESQGFKNFRKFNDYLKANKMMPMAHTYTPNAKAEQLYENITLLRHSSNSWIASNSAGEVVIDHKKELINALDEIIEQASKGDYPTTFNFCQIKDIITKANTPSTAIVELEKLGITQSMLTEEHICALQKLSGIDQTKSAIVTRRGLVGGPSFGKIENAVQDYIAAPDFQKLQSMYTNTCLVKEIHTIFSTLG